MSFEDSIPAGGQIPAEETAAAEMFKVEYNDETMEFTLDQLIALARKGLDYDRLAEEYAEYKYIREQEEAEKAEFKRLFPDVCAEDAKTDPVVIGYMNGGCTLAAAYALKLAEEKYANRVNGENSLKTTGDIGNNQKRGEYYSDEQLEVMSVDEIKDKLPEILARFKNEMKG